LQIENMQFRFCPFFFNYQQCICSKCKAGDAKSLCNSNSIWSLLRSF